MESSILTLRKLLEPNLWLQISTLDSVDFFIKWLEINRTTRLWYFSTHIVDIFVLYFL